MKTIIILLILSRSLSAQFFKPKQITFLDFDCRNPVFVSYPLNYPNEEMPGFIFEGHNKNSVNLYALNYDAETDSFFQVIPITNDTFINKNASALYYYNQAGDPIIVVWQTNKNGNWDLAYSIKSDSGWSNPEILYGTGADEVNPVFIKHNQWNFDFQFNLLFEKSGSIWMYTKYEDSANVSVVFQSDGNIKYHSPTGMGYWNGNYIAAIAEDENSTLIVYTNNFIPGQNDPPIMSLYDQFPVRNPNFLDIFYEPIAISFEVEVNGIYKTAIMENYNFGTNNFIYADTDTSVETTNYNAFVILIITEDPYYQGIPAVYQLKRNDSTFIISNGGFYLYNFEEIYTRVKESSPNIGPLGFDPNFYMVSYSVWEDSTGSSINLFGVKRIDPLGDVNDENNLNNFILHQNYPFNPTTKIKCVIPKSSFVTLKVYDILGREVATLVNEEKQPGVYEVEFSVGQDSNPDLASGIYFYRIAIHSDKLQTENYSLTKKMIYLK